MDKNVAGLIGAVSALVAGSAQAATAVPVPGSSVMQPGSYSDLLKPIPNARALLKAQAEMAQAEMAQGSNGQPTVEKVQYHHHHHHYHHRRYYHHHHHDYY